MAEVHDRSSDRRSQVPPIVGELQTIFKELPDQDLLTALRGPKRRGRPGYDPAILWHCFVAYYFLGLPSVSDLIRLLHDNPYVAICCGIDFAVGFPSQPTFSRFFTKISKGDNKGAVNDIFHRLNRKAYSTLPDYGKSVSMDATDLKAWSNGGKVHKSDPDAGWVVKNDTAGRGKFVWGYKLSVLVDTTYELPMSFKLTSGDVHEIKAAPTLLSQARWINSEFHPKYIIGDAGYSSEEFRRLIRRQYGAIPIIKTNPSHKKAFARYPETDMWQFIYNRRTSSERVFSRLKGYRKLNSIRVRRIPKVRMHCLMALIVFLAQALAVGPGGFMRKVTNYNCLDRHLSRESAALVTV